MTYYGFGNKTTILNNLQTSLSDVEGCNFIDWQRMNFHGIREQDYPGYFINSLRVDRTKMLTDLYKNSFSVSVVGFVLISEGEQLGTVLEDWTSKAEAAILADQTMGNQAYSTTIDYTVTDGGIRTPQGRFIMNLTVIYYSQS